MNRARPNTLPAAYNEGFSLVELLVAIGIMGLISAVTLAQYFSAERKFAHETITEEIVLGIREAQVYGLGSREAAPGDFDIPYGIAFSTAAPRTFILFRDSNGDDQYSDGFGSCAVSGECVQRTVFNDNRYRINALCTTAQTESCILSELHLTYRRPSPHARIAGAPTATSSRIELRSQTGEITSIIVTRPGAVFGDR